jgi:hypothetical protein
MTKKRSGPEKRSGVQMGMWIPEDMHKMIYKAREKRNARLFNKVTHSDFVREILEIGLRKIMKDEQID